MLCYITEWMVSNILQPPYCLEELDINYTSQKRNIRSDMGQLLKVPSVRHLNCFFFFMNVDIFFFFLWWTETSFFSFDERRHLFFLWWTQASFFYERRHQGSAYIWVVLQLSEYMFMVQGAPHLTGCYREHSEMHSNFVYHRCEMKHCATDTNRRLINSCE